MSSDPRAPLSFPPLLSSASQTVLTFATRHHRSLTAGIVTGLAGFGITAFGIAPLAPDAADLPRRQIVESVAIDGLPAQLNSLAAQALRLNRSELTRASDTADSLLRRLGLADSEAAQFLRADRTARRLFEGRPGKMVAATLDDDGRLLSLVARYPADDDTANSPSRFNRLRIERASGGALAATLETAPLQASTRLASGVIRSSLFAATDEADIPDNIGVQMAEMFSADIDFHRELRKGDSFSVVYESLSADGEPITWNEGIGRVLAAEFVNGGRTYQAVWFAGAGGKGGYFDLRGESKRRAFLASPMEFSRVTSGFAMRLHPIFQTWRAHLGTDYGAPAGTAVRTVGDGTVEFAGRQNGYGNVVQVNHAGNRSTLYAHLSRVHVKKGQHVEQGQRVGAVGSTGWATGPHLHFEFRVNGQHQDPLRVAKAAETVVLDAAQRPRFAHMAAGLKTQLDAAEDLRGLAGRVE
jgi:murein DD-endopeptidase MepM/ murein hydrolase activator NlpD